MSVLNVDINC